MGRGKHATDEEKGEIKGLAAGRFLHSEIARRLGRSRKAIRLYLNNPRKHGKKSPGSSSVLSPQDLRAIRRLASDRGYSARKIRDTLDLGVGIRRVQQILQEIVFLDYRRADVKVGFT